MKNKLYTVVSRGQDPNKLDWSKVFDSKVRKDRKLRERSSRDILVNYIDTHINSLSK